MCACKCVHVSMLSWFVDACVWVREWEREWEDIETDNNNVSYKSEIDKQRIWSLVVSISIGHLIHFLNRFFKLMIWTNPFILEVNSL